MKKYINAIVGRLKNDKTRDFHEEAKNEVELLLRTCNLIDPKKMASFEGELGNACKRRNYTDEYTEAILSHRYRYYLIHEKLKEMLSRYKNRTIHILEMGGDGPFTDILKKTFPNTKWYSTVDDLRVDWGIKENTLDIILSNEVLEHLSDLPKDFQETFYASGLKSTLEEAYKSLKKGGVFFITTPNASSINIVSNVLSGEAPWFFPLHIREYIMKELVGKLEESKFEIIKAESIHCMTYPLNVDWTRAFESLISSGYDCRERGDDLFIICNKPK